MSLDEIGPYRIERLVGRGGMGRVYEGRDWDTEERVAVKLLAPSLQDDVSFRERFEAEIETLKQLDHPNIVKLLGYGEQDGQIFYAMEFVEGNTLQVEIADKRHFTWQDVVAIGVQICGALKHAHDRGIVHRDLKPANLLVTADRKVKLTDFGIAKLFGAAHLTVDGGVIGTADYMSPEQAESRVATPLSDLYSLGGVLYALLAGRPPFASKSVAECLHRLRYETPAEIRRVAPDTPSELELILAQLLEKDPQKRVPTAIALANRLKSLEHALGQREDEPPSQTPARLMSDHPTDPADQVKDSVNHDGETRDATSFALGTQTSGEIRASVPLKSESSLDFDDSSVAAEAEAPPKARPTHYTTIVSDQERKASYLSADDQDRVGAWAKVAMMCLVFVVVVYMSYWFFTRPASSERMFEQIEAAMNSSDKDAKLHFAVTARDFLDKFPEDDRAAKVSRFLSEIRAHKFHARMERMIKYRDDVNELSAIELDYVRAIKVIGTSPELTRKRLQALLQMYSGSDDKSELTVACLRSAESMVRKLKTIISERRDRQLSALKKNLERARRLKVDDPATARQILSGIVELHGESAWAAAIVKSARQELGSLPAQ